MTFQAPETMGQARNLLLGKDIPVESNEQLAHAINKNGRDRVLQSLQSLYIGTQEEAREAREVLNRIFGGHGTIDYAPKPPEAVDGTPAGNGSGHGGVPQGNHRQNGDPFPYGLRAKVFGGKGALEFREDVRQDHIPTVQIDAAKAKGERAYDWGAKTIIQLTPTELAVVTAVFTGVRAKCEFKGHGEGKDKGFSIERQEKNYFMKVFSKDGMVAVPIPFDEAFHVGRVCMAQLKKSMPNDGLSGGELIALLKSTAALAP
ncbi:hypothetical protein TK90_2878 (plasmid) [Thioalkalivibrio sp. K90mix]|uniref:hypothetical protein n=1 Tax=Thioalkalivibrio sp. (strain K90mix) TaxID=396595 RepID=UPI000195A94E|nr:hypothetical protein [Thioalkalivibrio sp. K90mix]ADC73362.1 hypothetical protein TK90_2878 [Thioalkalivibrio sp. K90mix]